MDQELTATITHVLRASGLQTDGRAQQWVGVKGRHGVVSYGAQGHVPPSRLTTVDFSSNFRAAQTNIRLHVACRVKQYTGL